MSDQHQDDIDREIEELRQKLRLEPYCYDDHIAYIEKLKATDRRDQLAHARVKFAEAFPLTQQLWLDWLADEVAKVTNKYQYDKVVALFEQAVQDYLAPQIWVEYAEFVLRFPVEEGEMTEDLDDETIQRARDVFERALTACGLHPIMGPAIWSRYREMEESVLQDLDEELQEEEGVDAAVTESIYTQIHEQKNRITKLFQRQLRVPLMNMDTAIEQYLAWLEMMGLMEEEQAFMTVIEATSNILLNYIPYEQQLSKAGDTATRDQVYALYVAYEQQHGDPGRVQCVYERAIVDNALNVNTWIQYTAYLDTLRIWDLIDRTYKRAIRNCPWSSALHIAYMHALERAGKPIDATFTQALAAGLTSADDLRQLWVAYAEYYCRRIHVADTDSKAVAYDQWKSIVGQAKEYLQQYFSTDVDSCAFVSLYEARIEARVMGNIDIARAVLQATVTSKLATRYDMWQHVISFERAHGDAASVRKVFRNALNAITDYPEYIGQEYIRFEQDEGSLADVDSAIARVNAHLLHVAQRREKLQSREEEKHADAGAQKRINPKKASDDRPKRTPKHENVESKDAVAKPSSEVISGDSRATSSEPSSVTATTLADSVDDNVNTQIKPSNMNVDAVEVAAVETADTKRTKRAPKHAAADDDGDTQNLKRAKTEETFDDPKLRTKADVTAFVANLATTTTEEQLRKFFEQCGAIDDIRIVRKSGGASKGFAYVEFSQHSALELALKMDREPIQGRPVYVSKCVQKGAKTTTFDDAGASNTTETPSTEGCKLYVSHIDYKVTRDDLERFFAQYGVVAAVRLVTNKFGASKGFAYIEMGSVKAAQAAIANATGRMLKDKALSVVLSNPPKKDDLEDTSSNAHTGSKDSKNTPAAQNKTKTTVDTKDVLAPAAFTSMKPRAVAKKPEVTQKKRLVVPITTTTAVASSDSNATESHVTSSTDTAPTPTTAHNDTTGDESVKSKLSNNDFRAMLLAKK